MDIDVSKKVKSELKNLAMRNGKSVEEFAGDLFEKKIVRNDLKSAEQKEIV